MSTSILPKEIFLSHDLLFGDLPENLEPASSSPARHLASASPGVLHPTQRVGDH